MKLDLLNWIVLETEDTGMPVVLWICPGGSPNSRARPFVLARTAPGNTPIPISLAAISITKNPRHLDGAPLKDHLLLPVLEFINTFHLDLLAAWNGVLKTDDLLVQIKSRQLSHSSHQEKTSPHKGT